MVEEEEKCRRRRRIECDSIFRFIASDLPVESGRSLLTVRCLFHPFEDGTHIKERVYVDTLRIGRQWSVHRIPGSGGFGKFHPIYL